MKHKVCVYVRNKDINPSGYYRISQYLSRISLTQGVLKYREGAKDGIYYRYHFNCNVLNKILYILSISFRTTFFLILDNIVLPNIVIINREIFPKYLPFIVRLLEKRLLNKSDVIWDFDDAILYSEISEREWNLLKKHSNKIIVTNNYLKNALMPIEDNKVILMPTTDGDFLAKPSDEENRLESFNREVRLVWIATASNIDSLLTILEELESVAAYLKDTYAKQLVLTCACNKPVKYDAHYLLLENIKWSRKCSLEIMRNAHIGIMPLVDSEFNKGKGGFKLIQFMSASLPIIASPIGMNCEIVKSDFGVLAEHGNWGQAVISICEDRTKWLLMSKSARSEWENYYSFSSNMKVWEGLINEIKCK